MRSGREVCQPVLLRAIKRPDKDRKEKIFCHKYGQCMTNKITEYMTGMTKDTFLLVACSIY